MSLLKLKLGGFRIQCISSDSQLELCSSATLAQPTKAAADDLEHLKRQLVAGGSRTEDGCRPWVRCTQNFGLTLSLQGGLRVTLADRTIQELAERLRTAEVIIFPGRRLYDISFAD